MTQKKELRRILKEKRRSIPNEERLGCSEGIARTLFRSREYIECSSLLIFISSKEEVDTDPIIRKALFDGKPVAAPRCADREGRMDFYYISSADDLERGAFGIFEPKKYCRRAEVSEGALCIVPGLAFDTDGRRIGYGGGYYDRFLSGFGGVSCGVCFDRFIEERLPSEKTDIPVDMIVTQSRIIRPKRDK